VNSLKFVFSSAEECDFERHAHAFARVKIPGKIAEMKIKVFFFPFNETVSLWGINRQNFRYIEHSFSSAYATDIFPSQAIIADSNHDWRLVGPCIMIFLTKFLGHNFPSRVRVQFLIIDLPPVFMTLISKPIADYSLSSSPSVLNWFYIDRLEGMFFVFKKCHFKID
jgi:hypothetical protein